eukprot:SM000019S04934  [mRNA]  locus=s19:29026:30919:- [translate_table: standard]
MAARARKRGPLLDQLDRDAASPAAALTMREIIRRAEASERQKSRGEGARRRSTETGAIVDAAVPPAAARPDATAAAAAVPDRQCVPPTPLSSMGRRRESPPCQKPHSCRCRRRLALAPQVSVVDGRIVVNEASLVAGAYASLREDASRFRRVEESGGRLNSATYASRQLPEKWSFEDTELWYQAVRQFGTDFTLIQHLFPGRTRRQIKSKYLNEDRNNPQRVVEAIKYQCKGHQHYEDLIAAMKGSSAMPPGDAASADQDADLPPESGTAGPVVEVTPAAISGGEARGPTPAEPPRAVVETGTCSEAGEEQMSARDGGGAAQPRSSSDRTGSDLTRSHSDQCLSSLPQPLIQQMRANGNEGCCALNKSGPHTAAAEAAGAL